MSGTSSDSWASNLEKNYWKISKFLSSCSLLKQNREEWVGLQGCKRFPSLGSSEWVVTLVILVQVGVPPLQTALWELQMDISFKIKVLSPQDSNSPGFTLIKVKAFVFHEVSYRYSKLGFKASNLHSIRSYGLWMDFGVIYLNWSFGRLGWMAPLTPNSMYSAKGWTLISSSQWHPCVSPPTKLS